MKNTLLFYFLGIVLVFGLAGLSAPVPAGGNLFGLDVFNTKPFECGKQFHTEWINDVGDIKIFQSQLWMGMYQGNVGDLGYQVHRVSDSSLLFRGNWDHYAEPVGIDGQLHMMNFTPNYFELREGDSLELWYKCQTPGDVAHIIVTIWYLK